MGALDAACEHPCVREVNDTFRQIFAGGQVVLTAGVAALPKDTRIAVFAAVRASEGFDVGNDPHEEHNFGAVEVGGVRVFWKIDAYDRDLRFASPDPADPAVTVRVLTIMLSQEY